MDAENINICKCGYPSVSNEKNCTTCRPVINIYCRCCCCKGEDSFNFTLQLEAEDEIAGVQTISIEDDAGNIQYYETDQTGKYTALLKPETTYTVAAVTKPLGMSAPAINLPYKTFTTDNLETSMYLELSYVKEDLADSHYFDNMVGVARENAGIKYDGLSQFGNLIGTAKWYGGALAPNGKIYAIPGESTTVLEIDPETRTTSTFGNFTGTGKWRGGVLAPNGKIYAIPYSSTAVLEIDPETKTTAMFGSLTGTEKWFGGVLAPNGKIYGIPYNPTSVLEIDPETKTTATFGNIAETAKWHGGVLAPNGKIYGIPHESTTILEIGFTGNLKNFGSTSLRSAYINKF